MNSRNVHLPECRKMMQRWADYLGKLKAGADVIQLAQQDCITSLPYLKE